MSPPTNSDTNTNNTSTMRPSRACKQKAAARIQAEAEMNKKRVKKEKKQDSEEESEQCTQLVGEPEASQLLRWNIRSMWELASILNFFNVFRDLLNIQVEFSAEELETALISPNSLLADVHIPLLKGIPPIARMTSGHNIWITVLCRKLKNWWHSVAEGDLPIVASHGAEIEAYGSLEPGVRVAILKAICDIRVEQEDLRKYIDDSVKRGVQLSLFRKECIGGNSHGISYWYEADSVIGHRLYREVIKLEVKKGKGKSLPVIPHSSYRWETVATNLDEFQNVIEKLSSSENRTEISVAKKLQNDMLPEIEKVHKRKEKLLKKQHREALMLNNIIYMDAFGAGRSRRTRTPVTYTFDDYDRSINEAIEVTRKKKLSPEPSERKHLVNLETSRNRKLGELSPISPGNEEDLDDMKKETLDRSNRRRQKPQRYTKDFVELVSDNDAGFDSINVIASEVVYDDKYQKSHTRARNTSSSSQGNGEYDFCQENHDEEDEEYDSLSSASESDVGQDLKFEIRPDKSNLYGKRNDPTDCGEFPVSDQDSDDVGRQSTEENTEMVGRKQDDSHIFLNNSDEEKVGVKKRRYVYLNELVRGSVLNEAPNSNRDETADERS